MSNRVAIEPTEFINVRSGEKSLGVRIYDDYDQTYDNTWDDIPDNDMDILKRVEESHDEKTCSLMDFIREHENGVYIGGSWYEWDKIKKIMKEKN